MTRTTIAPEDFRIDVFKAWAKDWFLLTAGKNEPGAFNPMTVAWGSFGVMWNRPFAQVVVRPSRYTHRLMTANDAFTLCAFPAAYHEALTFCGTASGRDTNKIAETRLTPIPSVVVETPGYDEAELIIECRRIYHSEFEPGRFETPEIESCYDGDDYHTIYFGEILAITGTDKYRR